MSETSSNCWKTITPARKWVRLSSLIYNAFLSCRGNGVINEAGCWNCLVGMTLGPSTLPRYQRVGGPVRSPHRLAANLSTNHKRKPKWRRCVAASTAVGPSTILTGSRTRPSDWGWNRRFGPVEDRRNNRRLATVTGGCLEWHSVKPNTQSLKVLRAKTPARRPMINNMIFISLDGKPCVSEAYSILSIYIYTSNTCQSGM